MEGHSAKKRMQREKQASTTSQQKDFLGNHIFYSVPKDSPKSDGELLSFKLVNYISNRKAKCYSSPNIRKVHFFPFQMSDNHHW